MKKKNIEKFIENIEKKEFVFKNNKLDNKTISDESGIGIRVFENGKVANSFAKSDSISEEEVIKKAFENLKYIEKEGFCPKVKAIKINENSSKKSNEKIDYEKIICEIEKKLEKFSNDKFSFPIVNFEIETTKVKIENNGIKLYDENTYFSIYIYCKYEDKNKKISETGFDYQSSLSMDEIDIEELIKNAKLNAEIMGNKSSKLKLPVNVALDNQVVIEFLKILKSSLSAENVLHKKTMFADKNTKLDKKVTIIDDGTLENKIGTSLFDDEGIAKKKNVLIKNGEIISFLHNAYTSNLFDVESTGNADRESLGEVGISSNNFYLKAGSESFENFFKDEKVILITEVLGTHTINETTGDFSLGAKGILLKNNKKTSVKDIMINGNIKKIFQNIIFLSNDLKFYGSYGAPKLSSEYILITQKN